MAYQIWNPKKFYPAGSNVTSDGANWTAPVANQGARPGRVQGAWTQLPPDAPPQSLVIPRISQVAAYDGLGGFRRSRPDDFPPFGGTAADIVALFSGGPLDASHVLAANGTIVSLGGGGAVASVNGQTGAVVLTAADILGFATVATSGLYSDLTGTPSLAAIATSGSASDLSSGTVPIARIPTGSTGSTVPFGNDSRFSDARTPTAHASTHAAVGTDPVTLTLAQITGLTAALALLAPLANPTFTGTPAGPTAAPGTNTTQLATTAFVAAAVAGGVSGALLIANNLSDLASPATARSSLGLATVASSGAYSDLSGTPSLAAIATSGSAADLSTGTVPIARIPTGTTGSTVPFGNDARFSDARTPTAHASSHAAAGSDAVTLTAAQITGLAAVATSGSASDLGTGALPLARFGTQTANTFLSGPSSGAVANPTFRAIVAADLGSVLTTKGDFLSYSTLPLRVSVGADYTIPIADSTQAVGWRWGYVGASTGVSGPDTPPSSPSTLDDEFDSANFLPGGGAAKWVWQNQGTASFAVAFSAVTLTAAAAAGDNYKQLLQVVPAGDWTITVKLTLTTLVGASSGGLVLRESTSGKVHRMGLVATNPTASVNGWTVEVTWDNSDTSFNSSKANNNYRVVANGLYLRVQRSGTTLNWFFSNDGITYSLLYTQAQNAFFTTGPTHVGLQANANSASGSANPVFAFFRKI